MALDTSTQQRRGLQTKYHVRRVDNKDATIGDKHYNCPLFVLDIKHDEYARAALKIYAFLCTKEHPELSKDLWEMLKREDDEKR